jgi:hypothetical protein
MGTGKTSAQKSLLLSFIKQKKSEAYIIDCFKEDFDYSPFYSLSNTHSIINNISLTTNTINLIHKELKDRLNAFGEENVRNITEFEMKTQRELKKILICCEDLDSMTSTVLMDNYGRKIN